MRLYLETDRLILREFTPDDADLLVALDSDPAVTRYINGGQPTPLAVFRDEILPRWLAYHARGEGFGYWAAIERERAAFLGWFHLRPAADAPADIELGYRLHRAAWGRGHATEGARALLARGFGELGVGRVVARALADNAASIRVMQKIGLRPARAFVYQAPGRWHHGLAAVEYALTRAEWAEGPRGRS
jgi:RimJ/RimL family protein N-acetyltransferase